MDEDEYKTLKPNKSFKTRNSDDMIERIEDLELKLEKLEAQVRRMQDDGR